MSLSMALTRGRAALAALLTTSIQIERTPLEDDDMGGQTRGAPAIVATVLGNVQASGRSPEELALADRLAGRSLYRIALPVGADVQADDVLIAPAKRYQVVAPLQATLELTHVVICVEE